MADVTMPQLGETVTEGTITQWFKNVGDSVAMDEILFEVSTDKVDSEVPSPVAGVVTEILAAEGDVVEVGGIRLGFDLQGEEATATSRPPAAGSSIGSVTEAGQCGGSSAWCPRCPTSFPGRFGRT